MDSRLTFTLPRPVLFRDHVVPPSVVLYTRFRKVAAYATEAFEGFTATAGVYWANRPLISRVHPVPPSVVLNTPLAVPAYAREPFAADTPTLHTVLSVRPVFLNGHVAPPSGLRRMPSAYVPAYTTSGFEGLTASDSTSEPPTSMFHPPPPSSVEYTPTSVPAYTRAGVSGLTASAWTFALGRPDDRGFHWSPPLVVR